VKKHDLHGTGPDVRLVKFAPAYYDIKATSFVAGRFRSYSKSLSPHLPNKLPAALFAAGHRCSQSVDCSLLGDKSVVFSTQPNFVKITLRRQRPIRSMMLTMRATPPSVRTASATALFSDRERHLIVALLCALFAIAALVVLLVSALWTPEQIAAGAHLKALNLPFEQCPGCPWCGMSRAFSAVSHLRFGEAFGHNPAVLIHYPMFAMVGLLGPLAASKNLRAVRRS
jgi:hypothetical protein